MRWLIETGVFPDTAPRVCAAIEARGDHWTRYDDGDAPPHDVFWGSLGAADHMAGAIGDVEQFRVASYAPHLREWLVNATSIATTVRDLVAHPPTWPRVFVRPDSALKPFAGRVLDSSAITLAALDHGFYYDDDALPIVVSPARTITREWRTVVGEGRVIAGCEYAASRRGVDATLPEPVRALAARVATHAWQPASIYIVDLAEADGELGILELNPFSGADFYHCDPHAIVAAVARVAG